MVNPTMPALDDLSLSELKQLKKDVAKAITGYEDRQRKMALVELEAKAKELGFSLSELLGGKARGPKGIPKYVNPDDKSQTWTGRGRRPDWVKTALEAGKTIDDLEL